MDNKNNRKVILRFRFIVIFSVLLLLAVFIVYVISTSIEDVYEREGKEPNKPTAETTTSVTTTAPISEDATGTTLKDLAIPDVSGENTSASSSESEGEES